MTLWCTLPDNCFLSDGWQWLVFLRRVTIKDDFVWCFAEKWSMHVCECKRLPRWTDVRMSIRSSLTWLQGTDCVPGAIAPGITGESHSHPLAHGNSWD